MDRTERTLRGGKNEEVARCSSSQLEFDEEVAFGGGLSISTHGQTQAYFGINRVIECQVHKHSRPWIETVLRQFDHLAVRRTSIMSSIHT